MPCPTCQHTMHGLGLETDRTWWCPRCGTLKSSDAKGFENVSVPKLPERIREAETLTICTCLDGYSIQYAVPAWHWTAICESVGMKPHEPKGVSQ